MYSFLISTHSHTRWLVLVAGLAAVIIPFLNNGTGKRAKTPALAFLIICDLQLLLGLMLYFGESAFGMKAFSAGFGEVMKNAGLRKIAVEHFTMMLLAVILVHIGYTRIKRTTKPEFIKKTGLIFFGAALVLILAGIPWFR